MSSADSLILRTATAADIPALHVLVAASVRGLQTAEYTEAQREGALGGIHI